MKCDCCGVETIARKFSGGTVYECPDPEHEFNYLNDLVVDNLDRFYMPEIRVPSRFEISQAPSLDIRGK